ncbi:uncharacterized protein A1O5_00774 [Cladophialophora psammophila CBS 110553]|uniref:Uncharacterized protein n=1 Tax=Cladophialophora psammophila CBS 110553 TaxID=1182543 RepID=W9XH42_9EURO|nr:uncharacterized protein A1O5_00774 [Cladophialophora psammophila CBS 110553]EXJ76266.1 hypothetical protein A1O5_00774 [Cladophialophora psammophila CBS 110553]
MTGSAGFPHVETEYSDLCLAHVSEGTLELPDGQHVAKVVTASDCMRIKGNIISIDARASALSDDGSLNLEFAYTGKMHVTPDVVKTFSWVEKCEVNFGKLYCYTVPRIFSRSEQYAWVNDTVRGAGENWSRKRREGHYFISNIQGQLSQRSRLSLTGGAFEINATVED